MKRRLLPFMLLCAGASRSLPVLAGNSCLLSGDPQLSFPGPGPYASYVFGVTHDPTYGYGLYLCSPTDLDLSWLSAYGFGDFNHDGFEDLMFGRTSSSGGAVLLFLNDKTGSGTTVLSATLSTGAGAAPTAVQALDLNGDGWDDILTANGGDGTFTVLLNDGSGGFPTVKQYAAGTDVAMLAAADVNGDGFPDVIADGTTDHTVSVFLNNGDGTFAAPAVYHLGGAAGSLIVGDLNGDGYPDIYVSSGYAGGSFVVLPPSGTAGGTQELMNNGDGTFTASAWKPYSSGLAGASGGSLSISGADVTVSATDLGQLLGSASVTPTPNLTITSGGIIKLPAGTPSATVTPVTGGSSGKVSGGKTAVSAPASGGGGALEWLSLLLLGVMHLFRRKRA